MNARERLERRLRIALPEDSAAAAAADLDAFRAEVLAEAKVETVAWLVKKAAEQPAWDAAVLASKVDRGAVRAFLGTGHYRDAMDTHRAEVLAEAADIAEAFQNDADDAAAYHHGALTDSETAAHIAVRRVAKHLRQIANPAPSTTPEEGDHS
jgi:hypothetical protein